MKKTIFLTGATGNMGWAGFQELYKRKERFHIRILARPSKKNKEMLKAYISDPDVTIIWGDLTSYEDVLSGVTGSDMVLHVGGMVSPAADYFPEKTLKINVLAAEFIAQAVLEQPNKDKIKVVYIGSVAQNGDRRFPNHWGRTGDPVIASRYDMYSVSKCKAEKAIVDSGIKTWVSLRQSGILYPGILKVVNPTAFHVPVRGVLEWATIEDSGRLLAQVCEDWVPKDFWNKFYNISSGEEYRMTNYEFETRLLTALGLPAPEKVFKPQWFATRNFHGMWYSDADKLEDILHFRANTPVDEYFAGLKSRLPWYYSLAFLAPAFAVRMFMKPFAFEKEMGTQWWVKNDKEKFEAYFGSMEEYKGLDSWEKVRPPYMEKNQKKARRSGKLKVLDHGWDESKPLGELTLNELQQAAEFRGGKHLGPIDGSDLHLWECEHGHRFEASLEYVLLGGGWCTECNLDKWIAETTPRNRFISQLK